MSEQFIRITEGALRAYIEDLIQSEDGPSESDIEYINAEREKIRKYKLA